MRKNVTQKLKIEKFQKIKYFNKINIFCKNKNVTQKLRKRSKF